MNNYNLHVAQTMKTYLKPSEFQYTTKKKASRCWEWKHAIKRIRDRGKVSKVGPPEFEETIMYLELIFHNQ